MPIKTPHYELESFGWGDIYSSKSDRRRFVSIDNQLAFLSDIVGPGVINGWALSVNENNNISISSGIGLIGRRVSQSFGIAEVEIAANTTRNIYMKAKVGEVGGISGNSNIVSVVASDSIPLSDPTGLEQESSIALYLAGLESYTPELIAYLKRLLKYPEEDDNIELIPYSQVAFSWTINTEVDLSHYIIKRADSPEYGDYKEIATTVEVIYIDIDLNQNTTYYYQIIAVDLSGNKSSPSEIFAFTSEDSRIPLPPVFIEAFPSNETLEVIWDNSPSDNVVSYNVEIQPLDNNYNNDGISTSSIIDKVSDNFLASTYAIFYYLENDKNYKITIYSISAAGFQSDSISINTKLSYLAGAGEINDINIDFSISSFENIGLETEIAWRYNQIDPYLPFANKFHITFIENGNRISDPIEVLENVARELTCPDGNDNNGYCYSLGVKYIPYIVGGKIIYESIKEYTSYLILIQTVDENDNISNGVISRIERTPVSEEVSAITNFNISRKNDNTLFLSWKNTVDSYFSYNEITINVVDLSDSQFEVNPSNAESDIYLEDEKIGRTEVFSIPSSLFSVNNRYDISITSFDVFGTEGDTFQIMHQFTEGDNIILPSAPRNLIIESDDTEVHLKWEKAEEAEDISFYKIYRSNFKFYLKSIDFSIISTIPSTLTSFIDYTVTNGDSYNYFVTAVDIYSNESLNPSNNGYIPSFAPSAEPRSNISLLPPSGLEIIANGQDAELSWNPTDEDFDGYQILLSSGNNYSFEFIGNISSESTTYVAQDTLLKDSEIYYYIVRKFKNEVYPFVTSSNIAPSNSLYIGNVVSLGADKIIDVSSVTSLANFEDPMRERTQNRVVLHKHRFDEGIDKRIELRSNYTIISWETSDFVNYITTEDIEGATDYVVKVSGTINEDYFKDDKGNIDVANLRKAQIGESPLNYEIDVDNKKIVFSGPLYTTCVITQDGQVSTDCPVVPYSTEPVISLEMIDVSEVDNSLSQISLESLSATQVDSGIISKNSMPIVFHRGRINERLLPLKLPMKTLDNIVYSLSESYDDSDKNKMGDAVTFYDIINTNEDNQLLAATSNGIWVSNNFGNDWEKRETFPNAVHRVYRSADNNYYALTNYNVYINNGNSFRSWRRMAGLEFVKIIRDIDEDSSGNLFISTDLGVFRLNGNFVPYIEDTWEKMPIFGARSSEAYALLVDEDFADGSDVGSSRIIVSNELGLVESLDNGDSWRYISDLDPLIKIRRFKKQGEYIFALADKAIYREKIGSDIFVKISNTGVNLSRHIEIFNNKIYITTDDGPKVSNTSNIYADINIEFLSVWPLINIINNIRIIVSSLNIIDNNIFVGVDKKLYIYDSDELMWLQYEQKDTIIPSFYVDGELQKLGFYYNNGGAEQNVEFDEIVDEDLLVQVSNKYNIYVAEYGGWAQNKYDAEFFVYKNGIQFGKSRSVLPVDVSSFTGLVFPIYTDIDAHKEGADSYLSIVNGYIDDLSASETNYGDDIVILMGNIYENIELFLSHIYISAKKDFVLPPIKTDLIIEVPVVSNTGEVINSEVPVYYEINQQKGTNYSTSVNIADGVFTFDIPFNKYDDMRIDLYGTSIKNAGELIHRDIEDSFEEAYSGLPSYLSQVQQINISKLGIFTERQWPNQQEDLSTLYQMKNVIPVDDNFYDILNSTINYEEQVAKGDISFAVSYPSSILYVEEIESILVGSRGGALSVNVVNLNIGEVNFGSIGTQMVRQIFRENNNIFILTDKQIFLSEDYGITWNEYSRSGLPNQLYSIGSIGNNLVIGTDDGIYIKSSLVEGWEKSVSSTSPVTVMFSSNMLFVVLNRTIQVSSNGYFFTDTKLGEDLDITELTRYNYNTIYVSTKQGLYSDNGTLNSTNPELKKIDLSNFIEDNDTINDVATDNINKTIIGVSNGSYILIESNIMESGENSYLATIHKLIIVNDEIWLFGYDLLKVPYLNYPMRLSTGVPL